MKALMREARKEAPQYRCHSLVALGEVLLAMKLDRFEEIYSLVSPILRKVSKYQIRTKKYIFFPLSTTTIIKGKNR
jgi:hypothetical protein